MENIITTHVMSVKDKTDYSMIYFTDMSEKVNQLIGFTYIDDFNQKYLSKLVDKTLKEKDIDEPEIYCYIHEISMVDSSPILGLSGEIQIPVTKKVIKNYESARLFMPTSNETLEVADFFYKNAIKVGSFFAMKYDEIIASRNNNISENHLICAEKEGYLRTGLKYEDNPIKIAELTDKFCPVHKKKVNIENFL
jgi:hypothetical protein